MGGDPGRCRFVSYEERGKSRPHATRRFDSMLMDRPAWDGMAGLVGWRVKLVTRCGKKQQHSLTFCAGEKSSTNGGRIESSSLPVGVSCLVLEKQADSLGCF